MKNLARAFSIILSLLTITLYARTQDLSLRGRSGLEISFGFWGTSKASNAISPTGVRQEAVTSGFSGRLLYSYGLRENFIATLSVGFLGGEASSTVSVTSVQQQASSVVPILVGVRYYIADPTMDDMVRLYLAASVGTFMGFEATNSTLRQEARSETVIGSCLGAGVDFFLSRHFKLLAAAGYNLMSDFRTPIGARTNYNGGDFSIGIGYVF